MEALKQIANIAGQSGLYRILKPSRAGVIVESLDEKKEKTMMGPTARVSVLHDISVYIDGDTAEQSMPLGDVFGAIADKYGDDLPVSARSDNPDLVDFFADVIPDYDRDRVRVTDIKKIVSWYTILRTHLPEAFAGQPDAVQETETDAPAVDTSAAGETATQTDENA